MRLIVTATLAVVLVAPAAFAAPDLGPLQRNPEPHFSSRIGKIFGFKTYFTHRDDPKGRRTSGLEEHAFGFKYKALDNTQRRGVLRVTNTFFDLFGRVRKVETSFQRFTP